MNFQSSWPQSEQDALVEAVFELVMALSTRDGAFNTNPVAETSSKTNL